MNPTLDARAKDGPIRNQLAGAVAQPFAVPDPAYAITAGAQGKGGVFGSGRDSQDTFVVQQPYTVANCLTQRMHKGINTTLDEGQTPVLAFHPTQDPITSTDGTTHAMGCGSSGGQASVAVAYTIDEEKNSNVDMYGTLQARRESGGFQGVVASPVAFSRNDDGRDVTINLAPTMRVAGRAGGMLAASIPPMQVRRLTPVECERLQGFPDGYTAIPWRNKPADQCPDGPRYKALGNSWAVPVVRWIGERIARACHA